MKLYKRAYMIHMSKYNSEIDSNLNFRYFSYMVDNNISTLKTWYL